MRVVVIGATGNLGSATVRELSAAGHEVVGVARRTPTTPADDVGSVTWIAADVTRDDLARVLDGADAAVHLAWRFQPTRRPEVTWDANAVGTRRVLEAAARCGLPALVAASSVAAYSPVDHDRLVDESWPTDGTSPAAYCREKAYVERLLDTFETEHPDQRVVRLRPAFVFQRSAASEQRRIFGGPLAHPALFGRGRLPVIPYPRGLRMQAVHTGDVARAALAAVERPVNGPLNLAGDGVLRRAEIAELLGSRVAEVPAAVVRSALAAGFRTRAAPVPPELFDALLRVPLLDAGRARELLDWEPQHTAADAVAAFLSGATLRAGSDLPPLHR